MARDIHEWVIQLTRRFHANACEALCKRISLPTYSASKLPLTSVNILLINTVYIYIEARKTNEDIIVRRLHGDLDPTLAAVTLHLVYNTMDDFTAKTYAAESQDRRQYY